MHLTTYLNYPGTCEAAFRFYEEHLGGQVTSLMKHGENPAPGRAMPDGWGDKVLHARIELGGNELLGADVPSAEPMRSAYLTLSLESDAEADRVYDLLAEGGQIFMAKQETFFASRFAMLRDRFGTSWMLMCQRSATAAKK